MSIKKELLKVGRIPSQLFRRIAPPFLQPVSIDCGKRLFGTKFILIACMPKSGSTFLASALGGLPGFRLGSAVPGLGRREQEIDEGSLIGSAEIKKNTVFQHHVCHSEPLERLLQKYPFHVVVLSRDLRDAAASFLITLIESPQLLQWHIAITMTCKISIVVGNVSTSLSI